MPREPYYSHRNWERRAESAYPRTRAERVYLETAAQPGYLETRVESPLLEVAAPPRPRAARLYLGGLLLLVVLLPFNRLWGVEVLLILLLLTLPGLLLLRALKVPSRVIADQPALVPCASIILLLFTGLALDLVGPLIAISAPLRTIPILIAIEVVCGVLLFISRDAGPEYDVDWKIPPRLGSMLCMLLLPVASAVGALHLNNGYGNMVAIVAVVACVAALIVTLLRATQLDEWFLITVLFCASFAMMLSFSLRGSFVYGFDISTEYQRFASTTAQGIWHTAHHNDAYGAMLSLTVMPTELHFLTGVSDLMLFKLVYPLFAALFAIEIFGLARHVLSPTWSYAAASFTIVQSGFVSEFPALARQEVALALFGVLVPVILYRPPKRTRTAQWTLIVLLSLGMVVSHYSTTYVAISVFGAALVLQWLLSWFRAIPRVTGSVLLCFVTTVAGAFIWYGPVTGSATGLSAFTQALTGQGLNLFPNQSSGKNPIAAFLGGGQLTMPAKEYQQEVHAEYVLENSSVAPLDDAGLPRYNLQDASAPESPVTLPILHGAFGLATLLAQEVLNLLGAIGAGILVFRRESRLIARLIGLLALGVTVFLLLMRLSGTLATFYNTQRALLQGLEVFSITFCWALQRLERKFRYSIRTRIGSISSVLAVSAVLLTALVINTSSLMEVALGGSVLSNLTNSGEDYERFVRTPQELAAASWFGAQVRPTNYIYAGRYAQLPLVAMTGLGPTVNSDVTPLTIDRNGWVYASSTNTVDGLITVLFKGYMVSYAFPAKFLNENFDVVYSNGASEVYHR